jgi:hypothetical protein
VNLEQLTIHKITTRPYDSTPSRIPPHSSIRNLKSLTIRQSEQLDDPKSVPYSLQMFENALKLETFAPAYVTRIVQDESFSQGFHNNFQWFSQSYWPPTVRKRLGTLSYGSVFKVAVARKTHKLSFHCQLVLF